MTQQSSAFYWLFLLVCIGVLPSASAQNDLNVLHKAAEGLYFMYYDSSNSKSVVVEMTDYLTLIEVPVCDQGGSATNLKDHSAGGEKVLRTLAQHFPGKPLRYLLHSHWHPHSLSSVNPFLKNGVVLYTTRSNYVRIREFTDSTLVVEGRNVMFVDADSAVIGDLANKVVMHRFRQQDFSYTPAPEYLYFHLPRYDFLHCGCMFTRTPGSRFEEKEVITGRAEDLHRLIDQRDLAPRALIRLSKEKNHPEDMQPFSELDQLMRNGIRASTILKRYADIPDGILLNNTDSITDAAIASRASAQWFNTLAYNCLNAGKTARALAYARIQTMINPSDANAWDTLGEIYWSMGQFDIARHYGRHSRIIAPEFRDGGELVWQKGVEMRRESGAGH